MSTESASDRADLAAALTLALSDPRTTRQHKDQLDRACPGLTTFLAAPFAAASSTPTAAQLAHAADLLVSLQPADSSAGDPDSSGMKVMLTSGSVGAAGTSASMFLNPTAFAAGAADFFVERAKDEAVYSFVDHLGTSIREEPFVRHGFPRSYALMQEIRTGNFQTIMPAVRSALAEDLQLLPQTLGSEKVVTAITARFGTDSAKASARAYLVGVGLIFKHGAALRHGTPPATALSSLVDEAATLSDDVVGRVALRITGAIAREFSLDAEDLERVLEDRTRRTYFTAFLAEDLLRRERWSRSAGPGNTLLNSLATRQEALLRLQQHLESASEVVTQVRQADDESDRVQGAMSASAALLQMVGAALQIVPLQIQTNPAYSQLSSGVDDAIRLNQALLGRDYAAVVSWVVEHKPIRDAAGPVGMRYVLFATNLAAAQSAEEVTLALRNASEPVGSYRAKRNQFDAPSDWNSVRTITSPAARGPLTLAVTGFVGGAYGSEETRGLATGSAGEEDDEYYGLALPVGLELSYGLPFGSVSLFAPLLDLGTVMSRRLGDEARVQDEAEVGWDQILAPGVFATVGFRRIPVALGYGFQQVAGLRETADGSRAVDVRRRSFFVAMDVTVFNLFRR